MEFRAAQGDLDHSFYGGAPGVLASGAIWTVAGILATWSTPYTSLIAFFFGGMLIHPAGLGIARLLGRSGRARDDNPLTALALESTVLLFVGLFLGWLVFQLREAWFYPLMLTIIGARYLIFRSLYGDRTYWVLGGTLILGGGACFVLNAPFHIPALAGGGIELLFAAYLFRSRAGGPGEAVDPKAKIR